MEVELCQPVQLQPKLPVSAHLQEETSFSVCVIIIHWLAVIMSSVALVKAVEDLTVRTLTMPTPVRSRCILGLSWNPAACVLSSVSQPALAPRSRSRPAALDHLLTQPWSLSRCSEMCDKSVCSLASTCHWPHSPGRPDLWGSSRQRGPQNLGWVFVLHGSAKKGKRSSDGTKLWSEILGLVPTRIVSSS